MRSKHFPPWGRKRGHTGYNSCGMACKYLKHFNCLIKHSIYLLWLYKIEQKINKWLTALGNKIEYNSAWPQENLMVGEVPYMNVLILAAGIPWHVIIDLWFIVIDTRQARGMCVYSNIPIPVDRFERCACLGTCLGILTLWRRGRTIVTDLRCNQNWKQCW